MSMLARERVESHEWRATYDREELGHTPHAQAAIVSESARLGGPIAGCRMQK